MELVSQFASENAAAKELGIPQTTLNRILKEERGYPRADTLQKIADYFETTVDWILTGRGTSPMRGPHRIAEKRQWEQIAKAIAGDDAQLLLLLSRLPHSLGFAISNYIVPSMKGWDRDALAALRDETAAWVKVFRTWINHSGVDEVRKIIKANQSEFLRRSPVQTDEQMSSAMMKWVEHTAPSTTAKKRRGRAKN